jgi:hypothetical protein
MAEPNIMVTIWPKQQVRYLVQDFQLLPGHGRAKARRKAARALRGVGRRSLKMARRLGPAELVSKRANLMRIAVGSLRMARYAKSV